MLNLYKKNDIPKLNQKKALINNDLNLSEYDLLSIFTLITIPTLLLISIKIFMIKGTL